MGFCPFFAIFCKIFIFFSKNFFFQFFFEKFISFYFLEFLSDFGANTLKMSEICYTFQKNLKRGNSLSVSHQNKQISILVYFLGFQRKYSWIFRSKPQIFEIFQKTSIRGANAWGNERVWSENHFSLKSSKNHGGGEATRIISSKKSHFWKKRLLNSHWWSYVLPPH